MRGWGVGYDVGEEEERVGGMCGRGRKEAVVRGMGEGKGRD